MGNDFAVGATLKFLQGYDAAFFTNHEGVNLTRQTGNILDYGNANVNYGLADQLWPR